MQKVKLLIGIYLLLLSACATVENPIENPVFTVPEKLYDASISQWNDSSITVQHFYPVKPLGSAQKKGFYFMLNQDINQKNIAETFGLITSGFQMFNRMPNAFYLTAEPTAKPKATLIFLPAWAKLNTNVYNMWFKLLTEQGYEVIALNFDAFVEPLSASGSTFNSWLLNDVKQQSGPVLQQLAQAKSYTEQFEYFKNLQQTTIIQTHEQWTDLLAQFIEQNDSLLHQKKVFLMGHGFGGSVAVNAAQKLDNVKGVVNIDGLQLNTLSEFTIPLLYFTTGEDKGFNEPYYASLKVDFKTVRVKKTRHYAFTDFIFWPEEKFVRGAKVALTGRVMPGNLYMQFKNELDQFTQ